MSRTPSITDEKDDHILTCLLTAMLLSARHALDEAGIASAMSCAIEIQRQAKKRLPVERA